MSDCGLVRQQSLVVFLEHRNDAETGNPVTCSRWFRLRKPLSINSSAMAIAMPNIADTMTAARMISFFCG